METYPVDPATNRISNGNLGSTGMYDANVNMTGAPGAILSYDVANRVVSANVNGAVEQYGHTADNRRITRVLSDGSGTECVLYGLKCERLAVNKLVGLSTNLTSRLSVRFGGKLIYEGGLSITLR